MERFHTKVGGTFIYRHYCIINKIIINLPDVYIKKKKKNENESVFKSQQNILINPAE